MIHILVAGDYSPKDRVANLLEKSEYNKIFNKIKPYFDNSDYSIVNLEAPIVNDENIRPIKKVGPALKCTKKTIDSLKYLGVNCVTLANNHFRDYGDMGVDSTISLCKKANIDCVGGGKDIKDAEKTLYKEINGVKLAIINCCEHEYSIADESKSGSNPLNPIKQYYAIKKAKENADFVMVIVHGGIEHRQLPSPRMVDTYRFFVDVGADVVVNHHQHCISGYEIYNGKPIFYGLGNFCFDWNGKRDSNWNEGYIVNLIINDQKLIDFKIIPFGQCNNESIIIPLKEAAEKDFLKRIKTFNSIVSDYDLLVEMHKEFLGSTSRSYLNIWGNKYLKMLCNRGFIPSFIPKNVLKSLQNKVMCESHRERLLFYLNQKLK